MQSIRFGCCVLVGFIVMGVVADSVRSEDPVSNHQVGTINDQQQTGWGSKMIEVKELNFGTVPRGLDAAIPVKVKNVFQEEIQITGLTNHFSPFYWNDASLLPISIPSSQERIVTVRADTIRFTGKRTSIITVSLLDPAHANPTVVELPASIEIRTDLILTPGSASFGVIEQGAGAEKKISIQHVGRHDWRLREPQLKNPHVTTALSETSRTEKLVSYELIVTLKPDAPLGKLQEQIKIDSSDVDSPGLTLDVDARVEPEIQATDVKFREINPGQTKVFNVVVRGFRPYKIVEIHRKKPTDSTIQDDAFKFEFKNVEASVQIVSVSFTAPDVLGEFEEHFEIAVEDRPQPISFSARGRVIEEVVDKKKR